MGSYRTYKDDANRIEFEESRNGVSAIDLLARSFIASVQLDCPAKERTMAMLQDGRTRDALDFFVGWYLTSIDINDEFWSAITSAHEEFYGPLQSGNTTAGFLRNGFIHRLNHDHYYIGMPGEIDWSFDVSYYEPEKQFRGVMPVDYMLHIDQFYPLVDEYLRSGRRDSLDIWSDYVDDHCLCRDGLEPTHYPCDLGYNAGPLDIRNGLIYFLDYMRCLYRATERNRDAFPSVTFIRALMKNLKYYGLKSVFYARANPQNWQEGLAHYLVAAGILLKPFYAGEFLFDEGIRAIENYDTCANLPDGSCFQRDIWYNYFWLNYGLGSIYELLKTGAPEYLTPRRDSYFRMLLTERCTFLTRILDYRGRHPAGTRATHVSTPPYYNWSVDNREAFDRFVPWALTDPLLSGYLDYVDGTNDTPPSFTSDAFPVGGYYYIRSGWTEADQYGFLFAPKPPIDGMRHQAINIFGLHAFGHDLLTVGQQNSYDCPSSPVSVDGFLPSTIRVATFGHKRMFKHRPVFIDHRTHQSETFDVVEGVYDGWYGPSMWNGSLDQLNRLEDECVKDVSHRRLIVYLRKQKIWLIFDTITGQRDHNYKLTWHLPTQPVYSEWADRIKAYKSDDICIDDRNGTISTHARHMPNLSIHHESDVSFAYETERIPRSSRPPHEEAQGHDYTRITQRFDVQERVTVLSTLYAERTTDAGLPDLLSPAVDHESEYGIGQRFTAPDGSVVEVLVSPNRSVGFELSDCSGKTETAIVIQRNGQFSGGMFLGCTELKLRGTPMPFRNGDLELRRNGTVIPIHAPLPEVEILPDIASFSDEISIELRCADPNVEIHYTLDGGDPTPTSPKYRGPIETRKSISFKTQGYRTGTSQKPFTMHGTHATLPSLATFELTDRIPRSSAVEPKKLEQGLDYSYFRCGWAGFRDLILYPESQIPDATGVCEDLFDLSERDTNEPFGFRYQAYLCASVSGDYIFLAPAEYMDLTIDAGYELTVNVDGNRWHPGAERRGFRKWCIGLEAGYHLLEVWFIDYRGDAQLIKLSAGATEIHRVVFDRNTGSEGDLGPNFPQWPNVRDLIWTGVVPDLKMILPGKQADTIPAEMLWRKQHDTSASRRNE